MIGRLQGKTWSAQLSADGNWSSDDPLILAALRSEFPAERWSEADGVFGLRLLADAAQALGAEWTAD